MSMLQQTNDSAPERAYLWLKDYIMKSPWDQETFLSENAIAETSQISRTPVREALLRLEAEGLLRRIPRKGAFIPALTSEDINEIMEVRKVIGAWATRKVATEFPKVADALADLLEEQRKYRDDPRKFIELDIEFHKTIVHAAKNSTLERVYDSQRLKQERLGIQTLILAKERSSKVLTEHKFMVDAIKAQDPEQAEKAASQHIYSTQEALEDR